MAQSSPGPPRRRRVSHPSTSSPRGPYRPGCQLHGPGSRRCSFSPKDSSLAATTVPPTQREARSCSPGRRARHGVQRRRSTAPSAASRRSAWGRAGRTSSACWCVKPRPTTASARRTAAATPSTTGTPSSARMASSRPAKPAQPRQITSAWSSSTAWRACDQDGARRGLAGRRRPRRSPSRWPAPKRSGPTRPANRSRSSMSGTERCSVVTTA